MSNSSDIAELITVDGQSTVTEASFNFINSIVGAGIIGLPFAVREAGLFLGIIMIIATGYLTDYSVRMLVDTAIKVKCNNYEDLCKVTLHSYDSLCLSDSK